MSLLPWGSNPNLNDELKTLTERMDHMRSKADDIQFKVQNEELHPRKKRKSEVTLWLKRVEKIEEDFKSIKAKVLAVENRGPPRALLSQMKLMEEQVDQLLKQGEFSQGLVLDDLKLEGIELVTEKLEGSTPLEVQKEVWSALSRGESRIGIYGMGGVGKTTVAMHVNNEIVAGRDDFKHVYYVTVSRDSSVHKLQGDISRALQLALQIEDHERIRAAEISMALKKREKSLLILDDIWEDVPMEEVGVAVEGDGCKLLITTRKRDVCRKMNCSSIVEMKPLLQKEAWDLFLNKLGNYEQLSDEARGIAGSICKECSGLPLAIITMARCMRGEFDEHVWSEMLRKLQNPSSHQDDMDSKVFSILKLSYEGLKNEKLRECLLYCALYPEDDEIQRDGLINRFIAAGLLDGSTRNENIDMGHFNLTALENASLLESVTDYAGKRCVKMHDLIRDMALKIVGCKGMVKARKGLKEIPEKDEWTKDLVLVSLMRNKIKKMDYEFCPECPNISVLILCRNPLKYISDSFFVHMASLRCLDLSETDLNVIPSLAGLTQLRDLNLSYTWIKELPDGVEELINLKYLDITQTIIQIIPHGLLSKLCELESFLSNYKINILADELMSLRQLLRFEGRIDDFDAFKQLVGSDCFDQLERYSINVGDATPRGISPLLNTQFVRRIIICDRQLSKRREVGFKVPHNVQSLELKDCSFGDECLLEALPSLCGATALEELFLANAEGIKCIVSDAGFKQVGYEVSPPFKLKGVCQLALDHLDDFVDLYAREAVQPHIFFGNLRELIIECCPSVKKIWLQNDFLPNLESISVAYCDNLEQVFATTEGAAIELPCLKSIKLLFLSKLTSICWNNVFLPCLKDISVQHCGHVKEIFARGDEATKLCSLLLHDLPELKSVCRNNIFFSELQSLEITWCRKMKKLGLQKHNMQSLRGISLRGLPELRSICTSVVFFPELQKLRVWECPKLKKLGVLMNYSMPSLREMYFIDCREMEEIFEMGDGAGDDAIQMPNLEELSLRELPELRSICRKAIVCSSLKHVAITGQDKLNKCPISVPRLLANSNPPAPLPALEASKKPKDWWNSLDWNDPATKEAFNQLGCLKVNDCIPDTSTTSLSLEPPCSSSDHQPDESDSDNLDGSSNHQPDPESDSDTYYSCTAPPPRPHKFMQLKEINDHLYASK